MGLHVSSHSRYRFEFPILSGAPYDCTADDKTGWAGPFTRAQLVELLWRVQEIRVQASGDYEINAEGGPYTGSISLDVTMVRQNAFGTDPANELKVFGNNMASQDPAYAPSGTFDLMSWRGGDADKYAEMYIPRGRNWPRKDGAGYWLAPSDSLGFVSSMQLNARAEDEVAYGEGEGAGTGTVVLEVFLSSYEEGTILTTLNLTNGGVTVPLQTKGPGAEVAVATSASLTITKWFKYATTA